jgi:hypothetical protein
MKLVHTIAAIAFAAAVGGMSTAAMAAPAQSRVCDNNPFFGTQDCHYSTFQRCNRYAQPNGGTCVINPKWSSQQSNRY